MFKRGHEHKTTRTSVWKEHKRQRRERGALKSKPHWRRKDRKQENPPHAPDDGTGAAQVERP